MKALILSCNTGQGHNAAGKAMLETFQRRGIPCEMRDTLSFGGKNASVYVSGSYIKVTQRVPRLFGGMYRAGEFVSNLKHKSPVYYANSLYANRLAQYITDEGFDTIVSPHLFPAEALTYLRRKRGLRVRSFGVATDYTCTPFWEETDVDTFFIPHESLRPEYEKKGFASERLVATGIPVSSAFGQKTMRAQARAALHLPNQGKFFLLMTGSMGFGDAPDIAQGLCRQLQPDDRVLVMVGRNERLRQNLTERFCQEPRVLCIPFTTEVPLYMDACDVLLTKPGGLSSTEAAVKNVPFVHTAPIPGCETINARLFSQNGLSIATQSPKESADAAIRLSGDIACQQRMLEAQRAFVNPNAADEICDYILSH